MPTLSISIEPLWGRVHDYESTDKYQSAVPTKIPPNGKFKVLNEKSNTFTLTRERTFSPYLILDWSFFQPALWAQVNSDSAQVAAQQLAFDVTARSAILNIQQSYFRLLASKALVNAYEKIYKLNAEQVVLVESKFNAGLVNIGVVEQAKSQL